MSTRMRLILVVVGVIALLAGAFYFFRPRSGSNVLRASGTVEATDVDVSFQISGKVQEVLVSEGDAVKPGKLLALLSSEELEARVKQVQASLEAVSSQAQQQQAALELRRNVVDNQIKQAQSQADAARMQLERLREGNRPQEIQVAEAAVAQAQAELDRRKNDFDRMTSLLDRGAVSRQEYDAAQSAYLTAQSAVQAAREKLALAREGARREDIGEAEARLRAAEAGVGVAQSGRGEVEVQRKVLDAALARERELQAQLDAANTEFRYTQIQSPIEGVVLVKSVESGEFVNAGTPVVTLGDIDNLWMNIYIPETQTGLVNLGDEVGIKVDAFPNETFRGRVTFISSESEFTPKTIQTQEERVKLVYRVKVSLENTGRKLKPGMPADAEIHWGQNPSFPADPK